MDFCAISVSSTASSSMSLSTRSEVNFCNFVSRHEVSILFCGLDIDGQLHLAGMTSTVQRHGRQHRDYCDNHCLAVDIGILLCVSECGHSLMKYRHSKVLL